MKNHESYSHFTNWEDVAREKDKGISLGFNIWLNDQNMILTLISHKFGG